MFNERRGMEKARLGVKGNGKRNEEYMKMRKEKTRRDEKEEGGRANKREWELEKWKNENGGEETVEKNKA